MAERGGFEPLLVSRPETTILLKLVSFKKSKISLCVFFINTVLRLMEVDGESVLRLEGGTSHDLKTSVMVIAALMVCSGRPELLMRSKIS